MEGEGKQQHSSKKSSINFLSTTRRKLAILPFILYHPLQSVIVGTPLPLPALFSVLPEQMAFFNFISFLVTLSGTLVGIGFWVDRRHTKQMDELQADIKEKYDSLKRQIETVESRVCDVMLTKNIVLEQRIVEGAKSARDLEDTKFNNLEHRLDEYQKQIQHLERILDNKANINSRMTRDNSINGSR